MLYDPFTRIEQALSASFQNLSYPPSNVYLVDNKKLIFEIALAGFSKEDLEVSIEDGLLKVIGNSSEQEESELVRFFERKLAKRQFTRSWNLGTQVDINSSEADFKDGILKVSFNLKNKDQKLIDIK